MAKQRKTFKPSEEIGVTGIAMPGGVPQDEFLPELRGMRGIRKYREMRDNDDVVGAAMTAMEMMLRSVEWTSEPASDDPDHVEKAEFLDSVMGDMSHTFEDHISEAISFLTYGWSYFEIVYKTRNGPDQNDPTKRSQYTDGFIGIRKLAPRNRS